MMEDMSGIQLKNQLGEEKKPYQPEKYLHTSIPKVCYKDMDGMIVIKKNGTVGLLDDNEKKEQYKKFVNKLLIAIHNNYAELVKSDLLADLQKPSSSSGLTKKENFLFTMAGVFSKNNKVELKLNDEDLYPSLNVLKVKDSKLKWYLDDDGKKRLETLLKVLKALDKTEKPTIQEVCACIYNAGCFAGTDLPKVLAPIILDECYLEIKNKLVLAKLHNPVSITYKEQKEEQIYVPAATIFWRKKDLNEITSAAKSACMEAAGTSDSEIQPLPQSAWAKEPEIFKGDKAEYEKVEKEQRKSYAVTIGGAG